MAETEALFFWSTVALYAASTLAYIGSFALRNVRWSRRAFVFAFVGFLAHSAAILARWIATGHPPVVRNYEDAIAGAWMTVGVFLALHFRYGGLRGLGLPVVPFAMLMLGYGLMNKPQLEPLTPAYQSFWLAVHVVFAWFAYSSYVAATGLAVLYLLKQRRPVLENGSGWGQRLVSSVHFTRLPDGDIMDDLSYRMITIGFLSGAVMLIAGSIWASRLWGSYWSWDPVETWALINWLTYAIYLHLRVAFRWRGPRMAWLAIAALSTVVISFWGVNYITGTLHSFRSL